MQLGVVLTTRLGKQPTGRRLERARHNVQLVINTFGADLRKKGDRFVVRAGSNKLVVSAQKVQSILITTAVQLSSDVITLAVDHKIDIIFLEKTGEPVARLWPHRMGSTAAIRRRQLRSRSPGWRG